MNAALLWHQALLDDSDKNAKSVFAESLTLRQYKSPSGRSVSLLL